MKMPFRLISEYSYNSEWRIFEFLSGAIYQCDFVLPIATLGLFPVTKSIFFQEQMSNLRHLEDITTSVL